MKLKWKEEGIKSPLARARGLGSAHSGAEHWWHQRLTSIAAVPLMLWLAWAVLFMPGWSYETFTGWLGVPVNAILLTLAVLVIFYHAALGARVIIEDYVHCEVSKFVLIVGIKLYFFAAAVACIFSVLDVAFGA